MKFFKLPISEQLLLIEVSLYTVWAWMMIKLFSFKSYAKWIKNPSKPESISHQVFLQTLKKTLKRVERNAFWKNTCFSRAIAARLVLKRKKISSQIYFGVIKEDQQLSAHAWIISEDILITGYLKDLEKYKVLYIFED